MTPISVLLVDDNPIFQQIATRFLNAETEVSVVGTAGGGEEAIAQASELRPQVVLLDLAMPDQSGLEVIPRLRGMMPEVGIIALTLQEASSYRSAAMTAGADDFIPKAVMNTELMPAIRRVTKTGEGRRETAEPTRSGQERCLADAKRVLVMEDNEDVRHLFCKALRKTGYQVYPAATIEEARKLLAQRRFDVFLCDIHMGDGLSTKLLQEQRAVLDACGTQVVVVSGKAEYRAMCEELGADFFLEKPVALDTLFTMVKRLTGSR